MKFGLSLVLASIMAVGSASMAQAQAFGIAQGTPISELKIVRTISPTYFAVTVPLPNDRFDSYTVRATPKAGVCKVSALGKTLRDDRYGTEVRSVFAALKRALGTRYNAPKEEFDFLKARALWDGPNEWAAAIRHNERNYSSFWFDVTPEIAAIELEAKALSSSDTYVVLRYEFANFDACKAEMDADNDQGL